MATSSVSNNNESIYAFSSNVIFEGQTIFINNYDSAPIQAVQSQVCFNSFEGIKITNNLGGGIFLRESIMIVYHPIEISQNIANYGGGIYAYSSFIQFFSKSGNENEHIMIKNNIARQSGGGFCLTMSTIIKELQSCVDIDYISKTIAFTDTYLTDRRSLYVIRTIQ